MKTILFMIVSINLALVGSVFAANSVVTIQSGASITLGTDAYLCAGEIIVNSGGSFTCQSPDDVCVTPTGDGEITLPVELASFAANAGYSQVALHWVTESEVDNLGFHVYRAVSEDGEYERLTSELIEEAGNTSTQQTYSFTDVRLTNGVTYWYKLEDVAFDGTRTMHGPISVTPQAEEAVEVQALPTEFGLSQNVPNPFNPRTTIVYQLPEASEVRLAVYNAAGQRIRTLVDETKEAGSYQAVWNGADDAGKPMAGGVYLYELRAGDFVQVRRMVLIR